MRVDVIVGQRPDCAGELARLGPAAARREAARLVQVESLAVAHGGRRARVRVRGRTRV